MNDVLSRGVSRVCPTCGQNAQTREAKDHSLALEQLGRHELGRSLKQRDLLVRLDARRVGAADVRSIGRANEQHSLPRDRERRPMVARVARHAGTPRDLQRQHDVDPLAEPGERTRPRILERPELVHVRA